jgi:hypothetical protein
VVQALVEKLRSIYVDFGEADAVWVKTTEFKGGAEGGPPLATNHDVKAVEYFIKSVPRARPLLLPVARVPTCRQEARSRRLPAPVVCCGVLCAGVSRCGRRVAAGTSSSCSPTKAASARSSAGCALPSHRTRRVARAASRR